MKKEQTQLEHLQQWPSTDKVAYQLVCQKEACASHKKPQLGAGGDIFNRAANLWTDGEGWKAKIELALMQNCTDCLWIQPVNIWPIYSAQVLPELCWHSTADNYRNKAVRTQQRQELKFSWCFLLEMRSKQHTLLTCMLTACTTSHRCVRN